MFSTLQTFFCFVLFLLITLSFQAQAESRKQAPGPITLIELEDSIRKILIESKTPAAGIAMVRGDSAIWVAGIGLSDKESGTEATENTMFRIGSTSKMYVSLAILKLQEEGCLSLMDKVRDLVPEIEFDNPWEATSPIRVEHLLEHTTGWDDMHLTEYAVNNPSLSLKEGLDFHPHSRTSRWIPGTRMAYCNSGPPVAAYILEKITGQRFEDYIQENFFDPMDMENMSYFASDAYDRLGATLYIGDEPQEYWNILLRPSGSINASPRDMSKMLRFFTNRGSVNGISLISESSLKRMEVPNSTSGARAGQENGYSLSNYTSPHKSFVYRGHNGGVNGGLTDFAYLPEHSLGYVVMINSSDFHGLNQIVGLIRDFQTNQLEVIDKNITDDEVVAVPQLEGYYISINPRMQQNYFLERLMIKHLWVNNEFLFSGNLWGRGGIGTYIAKNDSQYISQETGKIDVVLAQDPLAGEVVHMGTQVLKKISPILAYGQLILDFGWLAYGVMSVIIGCIWFARYWLGKNYKKSHVLLGFWPFLASICILLVVVLTLLGANNPFELLGKVSVVSLGIFVFSIGFAFASFWSMVQLILERKSNMNKAIYWHLCILSVLHLIVAFYLFWHGWIGIQTWT